MPDWFIRYIYKSFPEIVCTPDKDLILFCSWFYDSSCCFKLPTTTPRPPSLSTSISNPLYVIACSEPCFISVKKMTDPSLIQQLFTHVRTWQMFLKCGYNYRIARNCFKAFTHAKGRVGFDTPQLLAHVQMSGT